MNKLVKWTLGILVFIGLLIGIWYLFFYKTYMTLQAEDREVIEKSFLPDSDGKGYSDLAKKNLDYSLDVLKNEAGFSETEIENVRYFFILQSQLMRRSLLSKNKEEFIQTYVRFKKMLHCHSESFIHVKTIEQKTFSKLKLFGFDESEETLDYLDILRDKYLAFYDFKTMNEIENSSLTYDECLKVKMDKSYE